MTTNYVIFTSEGITSAPGTVVIDTSFTNDPVTSEEQRYNQVLAALDELSRAWRGIHSIDSHEVKSALRGAATDLSTYVDKHVFAEAHGE